MNKTYFISLAISILAISILAINYSYASKLISVNILDSEYISISFKDGEVIFRDDASEPGAYRGHDHFENEDQMIEFGEELNTAECIALKNWVIYSKNDSNYGTKGQHPLIIYRKSKPNSTTSKWDYKLDHWIYLKLPIALKQDASYTISIAKEINTDKTSVDFRFDIFNQVSEAIHTNIIGQNPAFPIKAADLYAWIGDGGIRNYSSFEGNTVWIYNIETKEKEEVGKVSFWKKSAAEMENRNNTGSDVWNIDFSDFSKPGTYRLTVDGVGSSQDFTIADNIYFQPYKYSIMGYYYMRIGEDQPNMKPVPRQPLFIPNKEPEGFTVYLTSLHPYNPIWDEHRGDTWDEPHFKPAAESMFWENRLPGNPTNPSAFGGHSDALDWDRHLGHVSNIYDMLLPFFLSKGKLNDDNLDIAESGNGIPDILDEAQNEVDMWLRLRDGDAYAHGLTNPTKEKTIMFQAGTTTMAAWANAANCAMLADCYRILEKNDLMIKYQNEAIIAFRFAEKQENKQLDDLQEIGDAHMRGRDFKMMAAAFLYNTTNAKEWEDVIATETVVKSDTSVIQIIRKHCQIWATAAYLHTPNTQHYPELVNNMKASVIHHAFNHNIKYMDIRPSRRSSNNNWWQTAQNMHHVVLAHSICSDKEDKIKMEQSMVLEADWSLGRNPGNIVEMTGLGSRHIVNCYTTGRNDGTPGLHPGHTPYNNLSPWGESVAANPKWFTDRCYPDWIEGGWPHQEAHFNSRYSYCNGEFTPRQTMRGKMVLYAYLHSLSLK